MEVAASATTRRNAIIMVVLLTLANFLSYADRMVLSALMQPIKHDFQLSDTQLGLLVGFVFGLVYAVAGIPIARLADRGSRTKIMTASLAVWSVMTAICGATQSFGQLVIARFGVGLGEAGAAPAAMSLLGDAFPPARRGTAVGIFGIGSSLGIAAGMGFGGWLGQVFGWRATFLIFSIPGIVVAALIALLVSDPPRVIPEGPRKNGWQVMRILLNGSSYRWALAGSVTHTFSHYGVVQWMPAFFMRTHGLGLREAGGATGLIVGAGMTIGTVLGGYWNDRLSRKGLERPQYLSATVMAVLVFTYAFSFWAPTTTLAFAGVFVSTALVSATTPITLTTLLNLAPTDMRATATALNTLVVSVLGIGLAPVVIGALSDALAPSLGGEALRYAMNAALLVCFSGAIVHLFTARAMRREGFVHA